MGDCVAGRERTILQCGAENEVPQFWNDSGLRYTFLPCAGVPCQDVSVAGKRHGLAGKRTGLFYEFARILKGLRPYWFVFENVPGLLSSNQGRDFAEILRVLMVECGYGVCWRVLDSQFFGVAQRRRRVFIVGHLGKPCPPEILFESTGGSGGSVMGEDLTLRELARRVGEPPEQLRQWTCLRLIGREGCEAYDATDIERIRVIQLLLRRGINLEAIARANDE